MMSTDPAQHDNPHCPNYGKAAVVWVDARAIYELELREREKENAAYRQRKKEELETWLKDEKKYWDEKQAEMEKRSADTRARIAAKRAAKKPSDAEAAAVVSAIIKRNKNCAHGFKPRKLKKKSVVVQAAKAVASTASAANK